MRRVWERLVHHFIPSKKNAYRPRILHRSWLVAFLALSLAAEGFLVGDLLVRQSGVNFLAAVVPGEIIALTNNERMQKKIGGLTENAQLDAAAQAKAVDMAAKGYFSHVGPDGKPPWQWISGAGYQYQYAGENLAVRFIDSSDVVRAWMASPSHRANIVKPAYTDIGVGVANGLYQEQPATFIVQYFGAPVAQAAPFAVRGAVKGAETGPTAAQDSSSLTNSLERQFAKLLSEPRGTVEWVLIAVVAVLVVGLALGFFIHIEIQSREMLIGGMFVASLVIALIASNTQLLASSLSQTNEASVAVSQGSGVVIDAEAASVIQP